MADIQFVRSFHVNPLQVEIQLRSAEFHYPYNSEADFYRGWSRFTVIPKLFELTVKNKGFPSPNEGVRFLLEHLDEGCNSGDELIIGRARKLYMDFAREVHTLGLLQQESGFSYVEYQKILDIRYNVDYVVSLLGSRKQIAVQSAMRARWRPVGDDPYEIIKRQRRQRRGDGIEWTGSMYWLTNRDRPPKCKPNGCWLFGSEHVRDLVEEIKKNESNE